MTSELLREEISRQIAIGRQGERNLVPQNGSDVEASSLVAELWRPELRESRQNIGVDAAIPNTVQLGPAYRPQHLIGFVGG